MGAGFIDAEEKSRGCTYEIRLNRSSLHDHPLAGVLSLDGHGDIIASGDAASDIDHAGAVSADGYFHFRAIGEGDVALKHGHRSDAVCIAGCEHASVVHGDGRT